LISSRVRAGSSLASRDNREIATVRRRCTALPAWLARRLLRADEMVTWVRGPRANPWWERYATHPALFLLALTAGAGCVGIAWLIGGSWSQMPLALVLAGIGIVLGSVYVLAIANTYFTRLVVTNLRLVILQGYEVCRGWSIDALPRSLIRYGRRGAESPAVDLDALQAALGAADRDVRPTDQFAAAKTIRALGKHLDSIKARERDQRPYQ
jgi:hypothetical protein